MRSFSRVAAIGGAVVALGLAAEAFAETAEKVLGTECPSNVQASLDKELKDPAIVLVLPSGKLRTEDGFYACLTGGLKPYSCDDPEADCPDFERTEPDGTARFYSNSPETICWGPPCTGGGCGCSYIIPPPR